MKSRCGKEVMLRYPVPVLPEDVGVGWTTGGIAPEGDKEYEDALVERMSQTTGLPQNVSGAGPSGTSGAGFDLEAWERHN
ncbi:hypothetical protein T484DRAFT_1761222 [Baffinella frigidus]|nr:hypothetical protein T484DRAFT_1761222 [Cryptophyta sp. CCMP2293]